MPGVTTVIVESSPPATAPTDLGVAHITGITERGPLGPVLIRSLQRFVAWYGGRITTSEVYDWVETYFREGGASLYMSRVVGPDPVVSNVTLAVDSGSSPLKIVAVGPGDWYDDLSIKVVDGLVTDTFSFETYYDPDSTTVPVEKSPELSIAEFIIWAEENSTYIRGEALGGTGPLTAGGAAQSLASGDDDIGNVTDDEHQAALDLITRDYGPGQVAQPGRTSQTAHAQLIAHGAANRRRPIADAPDSENEATLGAALDADRAAFSINKEYRRAGVFWPRIRIPGIVPGPAREVSYSALQCALIARIADGSPNVPAAGVNGEAQWVLGPKRKLADDVRERLNARGLNVGKLVYGKLRTYGWRSLALKDSDPNWWQFGASGVAMFVITNGEAIGENYVLNEVDPSYIRLQKFAGDLEGMMSDLYKDGKGSLWGTTAADAFRVDTGPSVNTTATLEDGDVRAVITYKRSPNSEDVRLELVAKRPTEVI